MNDFDKMMETLEYIFEREMDGKPVKIKEMKK